ncbi:MAG: hypothetical protein ACOCVF_02075 [bacterium]
MKNINHIIDKTIQEFVNEIHKNSKTSQSQNEEIQTLIDVILMNPEKYEKYI